MRARIKVNQPGTDSHIGALSHLLQQSAKKNGHFYSGKTDIPNRSDELLFNFLCFSSLIDRVGERLSYSCSLRRRIQCHIF